MSNDPLNALQMSTPLLTTAGGQKHFVADTNGHGIDGMITSLENNK